MTKLLSILILTCATLHAQSVILQASSAGNVRGTGAGNVGGVAVESTAITTNTYCDGRFEIRSDNTNVVLDTGSGWTWTRDANIDGQKDWTNSVNYCVNLTNATYSDWRLPSVTELSRDAADGSTNGLVDAGVSANEPALPLGHPFVNVQSVEYWTSTEAPLGDPGTAWTVDLSNGMLNGFPNKVDVKYVWPCRGP